MYGHDADECVQVTHITRPRYLEELIPPEVRARWGIDTLTPIVWSFPTLDDCEREISDGSVFEVRYKEGKMDSRIREIMKQHKIPTVHKMEGNIEKLRQWAVAQGKKLSIVQDK